MKSNKVIMVLSILALSSQMHAMMHGDLGEINGIIQAMTPSQPIRKEAAKIYSTIVSGNLTLTLPADFAELWQNTFRFCKDINMNAIEQMQETHMAYSALEFPQFARPLIEKIMGTSKGFKAFMDAFTTYEKTFNDFEMAQERLFQDVHTEIAGGKAPIDQDLAPIIALGKQEREQLTALRKMFLADPANKDFAEHIQKIEYLAEQHARWCIAFVMAINPEIMKDMSPETYEQIKETSRSVFTTQKVNAFKKRVAAARQK